MTILGITFIRSWAEMRSTVDCQRPLHKPTSELILVIIVCLAIWLSACLCLSVCLMRAMIHNACFQKYLHLSFVGLFLCFSSLYMCSFVGWFVQVRLFIQYVFLAFKGEITEASVESGSEEDKKVIGSSSTKFRLVGILVHSGQASGGHYYSYVLQR